MGLVNFAHGAVLMTGAYLASTFYLSARLPFAMAVPAVMLGTGVVGVAIERVLRPLENKDVDLMLIGTIGAARCWKRWRSSSGRRPGAAYPPRCARRR